MAKSNRESKKPKKEKVKIIAAAPSQKGATAGWQYQTPPGLMKPSWWTGLRTSRERFERAGHHHRFERCQGRLYQRA